MLPWMMHGENVREGSAYGIGHTLAEIAMFLNTHQLTRVRIHFKNPIACPRTGDGLDPASQAVGLKKMPSAEALEALAAISSHPLDENEQVLLRIIDLLVAGGFRIGEALTLPRDCWVEETALDARGQPRTQSGTGDPVKRCGLRYWPEKGGDPVVKWLPDCAVPLAKRAVDDLTRLCQKAREAAAVLERIRIGYRSLAGLMRIGCSPWQNWQRFCVFLAGVPYGGS